jgi:hypothetical protein
MSGRWQHEPQWNNCSRYCSANFAGEKNPRLSLGIVTAVAYCYFVKFSFLVSTRSKDNIRMNLKENLRVLASEESLCCMGLVSQVVS